MVASHIAGFRSEFPQLRDFSATQNVLFGKLAIDYAYHASLRRPVGRMGGARAESDDDGVWLYIDFHDPDSAAQIHTQPVAPAICFGEKRATFLLLEGKQTKPLGERIKAILDARGVRSCGN